jgi:hypothetical protein
MLVASGEAHLYIRVHVGARVPDPGEAPALSVVESAHKPRLDNVDLLKLMAASVHDLEVAV